MLSGADILAIQDYVRQVLVAEEVVRYAVRLTDSSRPGRGAKLDFIEKWVKWGAGLRASHALVIGAKARALLHGRHHVSVKDIQALAKPILRHRVLPNFYAEAEGITADRIVDQLLDAVPAARQRACSSRWLAQARVSRPGDHRAARHDRSQGAHHRRRVPDRAASQSVQGIQRRVCRVPAVPARRRSRDARLEGLRAVRQALRQEIRGRNQPHVPPAARRQRIDGLWLRRDHQAAIRVVSHRRARLPDASAARFVRPDRVRRQHFGAAAGERAVGPPARRAARARAARDRRRHRTSRSRCTISPPRSASAAWSCWCRICSTIRRTCSTG